VEVLGLDDVSLWNRMVRGFLELVQNEVYIGGVLEKKYTIRFLGCAHHPMSS